MSIKTKLSLKNRLLEQQQLLDPDSESDDEHIADHIESILLELIPTYYKYRTHLVNILKEDGREDLLDSEEKQAIINAQINSKCEQYKELMEKKSKQNQSRRRDRVRITEKIIEKQRKKQEQQRQLMLKYEAKEIQKMMGQLESASNQSYEQMDYDGPRYANQSPSFINANRMSFNANDSNNYYHDPRRPSIDNQIYHKHHSFQNFEPQRVPSQQFIIFPSQQHHHRNNAQNYNVGYEDGDEYNRNGINRMQGEENMQKNKFKRRTNTQQLNQSSNSNRQEMEEGNYNENFIRIEDHHQKGNMKRRQKRQRNSKNRQEQFDGEDQEVQEYINNQPPHRIQQNPGNLTNQSNFHKSNFKKNTNQQYNRVHQGSQYPPYHQQPQQSSPQFENINKNRRASHQNMQYSQNHPQNLYHPSNNPQNHPQNQYHPFSNPPNSPHKHPSNQYHPSNNPQNHPSNKYHPTRNPQNYRSNQYHHPSQQYPLDQQNNQHSTPNQYNPSNKYDQAGAYPGSRQDHPSFKWHNNEDGYQEANFGNSNNPHELGHYGQQKRIRNQMQYQDGYYEEQSEEDDVFSDQDDGFGKRNNRNNMVRMEYDQTHSQRNHKLLQRQNTPNFQTFSHKGRHNPYFDLQRQKLQKQRREAELLHRQVSEVLGHPQEIQANIQQKNFTKKETNMKQSNQQMKFSQKKSLQIRNSLFSSGEVHQFEGEDRLTQGMRFIMEQLCELWSICEFFKYQLKNKQYSILQKLCGNQIGTGPISLKLLHQGAKKVTKKEEEHMIIRIIGRIFGDYDSINFEDFGNSLKSKLNEAEVKYINVKVAPINPHQITQSLSRLFSVVAQILYFEDKLKDLVLANPKQLQDFKAIIRNEQKMEEIDLFKVEEFIYKTDGNRVNRLRIVLFLKNTIKQMKMNKLIQWLKNNIIEHKKVFAFMFGR